MPQLRQIPETHHPRSPPQPFTPLARPQLWQDLPRKRHPDQPPPRPTRPRIGGTIRRLTLIILAVVAAVLVAAFHDSTHAKAATTSCGNSYPDDGHPGPWRTTNNGGTWHGNTVTINCPTSSTYWQIRYCLQADGDQGPGTAWVNEACIQDDGLGDKQESFTWSPEPCSPYGFRTHIVNNVTGGVINKPSGGASVQLACG